jgi:hypothetical protein
VKLRFRQLCLLRLFLPKVARTFSLNLCSKINKGLLRSPKVCT